MEYAQSIQLEEDTQPISRAEIGLELYQRELSDAETLEDILEAEHNLKLFVGPEMALRIITHYDAERQFRVIASGLQLEYYEKVNGLVDLCSDSRFIEAKKNLTRIVGQVRASEVLHDIF